MSFLNQHSFTLLAVASLVVLAILLLRDGLQLYDILVLAALTGGLWFAHQLLNPGKGTTLTAADVQAQIGSGDPVLLEFQSPY